MSERATLFAFLFSDIEGSTARWDQNPAAMGEALQRHDRLMREIMAQHHGHIFKTVGDAFCVAFGDVVLAAEAAASVQRALAEEDFAAVGGLTVRIGIHAGPAECRDQDYFGTTLNRVARLMAAAHGGQIVLSAAAAAMVQQQQPDGTSLTDLGRHRLKDLSEPEQIYQLDIATLPRDFPALRSLSATPNNLPRPATGFIGREDDLAEVTSLLERHPMVTLLGAGGLGKTRLSIQVGADLLEKFPDGVWFVELAPLSDPDLVVQTLVNLFGLPTRGDTTPIQVASTYLKHKKLLLILDNCEHLVAAAAALADALIRNCPAVRLLASSREALAIPGEHIVRLPILAVPDQTADITAAEALTYPSVCLFIDRAAAALGRFELTDQDAPSIAGICRRLDGIALALELAAPRLKILKPAQLLAKLDDRFKILTGGSRVALPRQQTLRGLIDWSHDLLSEPEQILLRRLSVFAHGWTLEAAAAVTAGYGLDEWDIFDLLSSLVDKSLVVADQSYAEPRFLYLESTRLYALEKLRAAGEEHYSVQLARYLIGMFKAGEGVWETMPTDAWLAIYKPELDNLRAALDWAFADQGRSAIGLELFAYTAPLWRDLALVTERTRWSEIASAHVTETTPPAIAARIHMLAGTRTVGTRSIEPVRRLAVDAARRAGDDLLLANCLTLLIGSVSQRPEAAAKLESEAYLTEAMAIARQRGPSKLLARVLLFAGTRAAFGRDHAAAQPFFADSIAIARLVGDTFGSLAPLVNLAGSYNDQQDYDRSITTGREAVDAGRAASQPPIEMIALSNLCTSLLHAEKLAEAVEVVPRLLELARSMQDRNTAATAVIIVIVEALRQGRIDNAAQLWGWVDIAYGSEKSEFVADEPDIAARILADLHRGLDDAEVERATALGAAMTLDEAVASSLVIISARKT